jgi:signal transduction histidine kinase
MLNSFRVRLLLTLIIVVSVTLGTVALFASTSTTSEFERSVAGLLQYRDPKIDSKIITIQKYITQQRFEESVWNELKILLGQMASASQTRFVLTDLEGNVRADSSDELVGATLDTTHSKPFAVFLIESEPILAYFELLDAPNLFAIQDNFNTSVNRSLLISILVAGLVALILTLVLSQSMLRPINALTSAARKMERGDLSQRVNEGATGELGELAKAFNAMADGLEQLEQLRRNMVTDVAHELRTPLSNIRGYLEALRDEMVDPTPEMISMLHEEAMALNHLVDDLQELALAEAGQLRLDLQEVDVEEVVDKTMTTIKPQANEKGIKVSVSVPPELPPAYADPERLCQVLRNLLNNAITHTPDDGTITIDARQASDEIQIQIIDTGSGINEENLPFVFERFYRADKSRTRATGGAGLGLAIVKQLIEAQDGHVEIESVAGEGTTVSFSIPIVKTEDIVEDEETQSAPIEEQPAVELTPQIDELGKTLAEET